jgi:hypothetical protein
MKVLFLIILRTFLQENKVQNAFVALGLQGGVLQEQLISFEKNGDAPIDVAKKIAPSKVWNFYFLPRQLHDQQQVYFFSMAREIIMQYQLLALSTPFNCCLISSTLRALLEVTQSVESTAYMSLEELKQRKINTLENQNKAFHQGLFLLGKQVINEMS